jgi:lactoylglutathione lyase
MGVDNRTAFNHIGHCVTDTARAQQFYEEALGFEFLYDFKPPGDGSSQLLQVSAPVGLTATYLRLDGFILELLHYDRPGNPPAANRVMNEPGLTHLSVSVQDMPKTLELVVEHGGSVVEETNVGQAVMVRDPDGQIIEILPMGFRIEKAKEGF